MRDLLKLGFVVGLMTFIAMIVAPIVEREHEEANIAAQAAQAAQEAAEQAYLQPFQAVFASGDWQQILRHCLNAADAGFSYYHPPQALAISPDRLDVYVYEGASVDSLLRVSCSDQGLNQTRIEHPLKQLLAVEADDRERSAPDLSGEMNRLLRTLPMPVASIELLRKPDDDTIVSRIIRRNDQGWQIQTEPADAPAFARLSTSDSLLAGQAELGASNAPLPTVAQEYPRRRWAAASTEAFDFLDQALPAAIKARIAGLQIDDDKLNLVVAGPVPGFSFAYASIEYDAWGSATTWLYPYDSPPSFGCATGIPLAEVRQRFDQACAARSGCGPDGHFSIAFYSCAGGDDRPGYWQLHLQ